MSLFLQSAHYFIRERGLAGWKQHTCFERPSASSDAEDLLLVEPKIFGSKLKICFHGNTLPIKPICYEIRALYFPHGWSWCRPDLAKRVLEASGSRAAFVDVSCILPVL